MADEYSHPPIRLKNFVSQDQLDQAKRNRGERVEDGTAQRDKPLYEILKENKDRKDAEFNERFKHRPPKALDEDETEFLDKLETSRKEYEQHVADDEAQQLRSFQAEVAVRSAFVRELKETPSLPKVEEPMPVARKNPPTRPLGGLIIKVKPQTKRANTDEESSEKPTSKVEDDKPQAKKAKTDEANLEKPQASGDSENNALNSLVSYSDGSEDDS
ncbi:hypothetical protein Sjap_007141 [Stephania japonica]|uniref:FAM192A/Fyv6 N-terminal domain-containing protein n=1 Tax=Stephania japonica TaxID=461633 RepID=A0AAP0JPE1_9MAGN